MAVASEQRQSGWSESAVAAFGGSKTAKSGGTQGERFPAVPAEVAQFARDLDAAVAEKNQRDLQTLCSKEYLLGLSKDEAHTSLPAEHLVRSFMVRAQTASSLLYRLLFYRFNLIVLRDASGDRQRAPMALIADAYATFIEFLGVAARTRSPEAESAKTFAQQLELPAEVCFDFIDGSILRLYEIFHRERRQHHDRQRSAAETQGVALDPAAACVIDGVDCQGVWLLDQLLASLQDVVKVARTEVELDGGMEEGPASAAGASVVELPPLTKRCGTFALLALLRLHAKCGDFGAAVDVVSCLRASTDSRFLLARGCHLNLWYYAAFSLFMARRFADAARSLSRAMPLYLHLLDKSQRPDFQSKIMRKMAGLLMLCCALSPGVPVDSSLLQAARQVPQLAQKVERLRDLSAVVAAVQAAARGDSVAELLAAVDGDEEDEEDEGDEGADSRAAGGAQSQALGSGAARSSVKDAVQELRSLFRDVAPSFIDPSFPPVGSSDTPLEHHTRWFLRDALPRLATVPAIRSLFSLYDSIELRKVGSLASLPADSTRAALVATKMRTSEVRGAGDAPASSGPLGCTDADVHYSVGADGVVEVVHADDASTALDGGGATSAASGAGADGAAVGGGGSSLEDAKTGALMAAQGLRLGAAGGAGGRKGTSGGALESYVRTLRKVHQQRVRAVKNSSRLADATVELLQRVKAEKQARKAAAGGQ